MRTAKNRETRTLENRKVAKSLISRFYRGSLGIPRIDGNVCLTNGLRTTPRVPAVLRGSFVVGIGAVIPECFQGVAVPRFSSPLKGGTTEPRFGALGRRPKPRSSVVTTGDQRVSAIEGDYP
jgi:hypothetical protein